MTNFKIKKDKKVKIKHNDVKNNTTLDKKHKENSKKFKTNKIKSDELLIKLDILKKKLNEVNKYSVSSIDSLNEKKK